MASLETPISKNKAKKSADAIKADTDKRTINVKDNRNLAQRRAMIQRGSKSFNKIITTALPWFNNLYKKNETMAVQKLIEAAAGRGDYASEKTKALEILGRVDASFTEEWAVNALDGGNYDKATEPLYKSMSSKAE